MRSTDTMHVGLTKESLGHPSGKAQNTSYLGMTLGGVCRSIQVARGLTLVVSMEAV